MNKTLITLLLLCTFLSCFADDGEKQKKQSPRQQNRALMQEKIKQLKEGALLVRLKTKANTIAALRTIGKYRLAYKTEQKQILYNKRIIAGFKNKFNFCPVYFFFSDYSESVAKKEFNKVVFLNDGLLPDSSIKFTGQKFLTAEFGDIAQDTATYFEDFYLYSDENGLDRKKEYHGGADIGFGALVIKSDQFVQLRRPFPYYTRNIAGFLFRRKVEKVIERMDKKLFKYFVKSSDR